MARKPMLPPTYFLLALVAMAGLRIALPGPRLFHGGWWWMAGVVLIVLSVWIELWADGLFKRVGTEVKPFRASSTLVVEGPFRFSRNPMYLGMVGILTGLAILAGTLTPLLVVVLLAWLLTVRFIIPEERHMEEQFGEAYREYRARVRRGL